MRKGSILMVAFINSFLSYLVLFLIMAAIVCIGIFAGAFLRKKKNASAAAKAAAQDEEPQAE